MTGTLGPTPNRVELDPGLRPSLRGSQQYAMTFGFARRVLITHLHGLRAGSHFHFPLSEGSRGVIITETNSFPLVLGAEVKDPK